MPQLPPIGAEVPQSAGLPPIGADVSKPPPPSTAEAPAELSQAEKIRNVLQWSGRALGGAIGMGSPSQSPANSAVENPKTTLALAALGPAGKLAKSALPSAARAGQKFERVMAAAGDVPVDVREPGDVALRIYQLAERGGSMPKVARDFLKRTTDPSKPEMVYREARDFAHNISRLSADEFKRLTPVIRREITKLRVALNKSNEAAARSVGKSEEYASAMKEYRNAARVKDAKDKVVKYALPTGAAGLAMNYAYGKLSDLVRR